MKRAAATRSVCLGQKVGGVTAAERPEQRAQGDPAGDDLERDVTDVERFLDSDERAGNDPLVVAEEGARQQNDRNDAGGAGEGKFVRNDTRSFAWRIAAGPLSAPRRSLSAMRPSSPFRRSPHGLAEKTLKEIDRRSDAQHKRIAIGWGRISARADRRIARRVSSSARASSATHTRLPLRIRCAAHSRGRRPRRWPGSARWRYSD